MVSAGRQIINSYGDGRFRIGGQVHEGSVLVFRGRTLAWTVAEGSRITLETLEAVTVEKPPPRILLVGCGRIHIPPPAGLAAALRELGIGLEWMDTGAACRTFNVLAEEDRPAAAALVAVD